MRKMMINIDKPENLAGPIFKQSHLTMHLPKGARVCYMLRSAEGLCLTAESAQWSWVMPHDTHVNKFLPASGQRQLLSSKRQCELSLKYQTPLCESNLKYQTPLCSILSIIKSFLLWTHLKKRERQIHRHPSPSIRPPPAEHQLCTSPRGAARAVVAHGPWKTRAPSPWVSSRSTVKRHR